MLEQHGLLDRAEPEHAGGADAREGKEPGQRRRVEACQERTRLDACPVARVEEQGARLDAGATKQGGRVVEASSVHHGVTAIRTGIRTRGEDVDQAPDARLLIHGSGAAGRNVIRRWSLKLDRPGCCVAFRQEISMA